jgi:serine/threonine protein kinase
MTCRQLVFILSLATLTTCNINFCSNAIVNFKGYSCVFEEPDSVSKLGSKIFYIQDDYHKQYILKTYSFKPDTKHELDLLQKYKAVPSVVDVIDYKISNNIVMMILDAGNKASLDKIILNTSCFSDMAYFYKLARNLVDGIARLNQEGLSLTKIFPEDIIFTDEYLPLFTNLENAHEYSRQSLILGGSALLAPELIDIYFSNKSYLPNPSGDVYSFGLLLYFMKYKKYPYDEIQKSTFNALHQMVQFPVSEDVDFIHLIQSSVVVESKRANFDYLKDKIIEIQLNKHEEITRQRTKYQINDGRLIAFESENEKQKMVVLSIGAFVFIFFVIALTYIKCKKCLKKGNHDSSIGLITND